MIGDNKVEDSRGVRLLSKILLVIVHGLSVVGLTMY